MGSPHPVDDENNLYSIIVNIGDNLMNDSAHDAFFKPSVCGWCIPDSLQVIGQPREGDG
ncbi:hypothetical protein SAMN04488056_1042 [Cohaesibacter marisflavi]|uniref:Uncharacterized protein n=1 Tax=Cohaesibacter marisflavi TaxID=655353 RepID=A0A1I5FFQ2_9HYPH|nr:hypothetical protein SAMN04488056_1042 [Cohaesibacter marisflavi]